jgi:hypothetical protein
MRRSVLLAIVALLVGSVESRAQSQEEIDRIANTMVRLCVAGGTTSAASGGGNAGADLSLRSLDVTGKINGEFKVSKTNAEGLVDGLNNALGAVAAEEADKVRTCLQPVRERLLDLMLPSKKSSRSDDPAFDTPEKHSETNKTRVASFYMTSPPNEFKPGRRTWTRIADDRWQQEYPDGTKGTWVAVKHINVGGCDGEVVILPPDAQFQCFIPDKGCPNMIFLFRRLPTQTWTAYLALESVR